MATHSHVRPAMSAGCHPPVRLTQRATRALTALRDERDSTVARGKLVVTRTGGAEADVRWWTWAGRKANATLAASLGSLVDGRFDDVSVRMHPDLTPRMWQAGTADISTRLCLPDVDEHALSGLKFSVALPPRLAAATLAARLGDLDAAMQVLAEPVRFTVSG